MKKHSTIKKSIQFSFSMVAGASTIAGIWGYTIKDINPLWKWWVCGLVLIAVFIVMCFLSYVYLFLTKHNTYKTTINGKVVTIKIGDIFIEEGWKVIPFNDRFDTKVDDIIIAHNSLNGVMINKHIDDIVSLNEAIKEEKSDCSDLKPNLINGQKHYPLGRIIPYKDFLMLSFSHFDNQNRAFIGIGEYEQMLFRMWKEIRRVYAAKHVSIPLIGTGITSIEGLSQKNYTEILRCILCTLRRSGFQPDQGISIIITEEAIKKIDMNMIKEEY